MATSMDRKLQIAEVKSFDIKLVGYSYGVFIGDMYLFEDEEDSDCAGFSTIDLREVVYDGENILCIDEREFLYRFKDSSQKHQYKILERCVNLAKERRMILPAIEPAFEAHIYVIPLDYGVKLAQQWISELNNLGENLWADLSHRVAELQWAKYRFTMGEWCWAEVDEEED
jgi:hypothetical protein